MYGEGRVWCGRTVAVASAQGLGWAAACFASCVASCCGRGAAWLRPGAWLDWMYRPIFLEDARDVFRSSPHGRSVGDLNEDTGSERNLSGVVSWCAACSSSTTARSTATRAPRLRASGRPVCRARRAPRPPSAAADSSARAARRTTFGSRCGSVSATPTPWRVSHPAEHLAR